MTDTERRTAVARFAAGGAETMKSRKRASSLDESVAKYRVEEPDKYGKLYISEDKDLFHSLFQSKAAIESDAGLTFDWRELPERKASLIVIEKSVDSGDKDQWNAQFDWLMDVIIKMKKAFKKYL